VVGAPKEASNATGVNGDQSDDRASDAGAAYVFVRAGTNWIQQAYLKASNTGGGIIDFGDLFGLNVAISGDTIVVGAIAEDASVTGINGDGSNNSAEDSGAGYVFVRSGTNWTQQAYLKASNTGTDDTFGAAVAVSGDTVVIGAIKEESNATGVNGNQNDNSYSRPGAAYVFAGIGFGPRLTLVPDGGVGYLIRIRAAPGVRQQLQRAPGLTGPWDTLSTQTLPESGLIEFHDTNPPPAQAFYRTEL
jgi:hypothetical protein